MTTDEIVEAQPVSLQEQQKAALMERIMREVSLSLTADKQESYTRTEEVISPVVTRSIDLYEQDTQGNLSPRKGSSGVSWELLGSLGNILPNQMPFFRMANFNSQWCRLRDGIYLDIFDFDEAGKPRLDEAGNPILLKTEVVDISQLNRDMIANTNLALNANRAKLSGQTLVGQAGGSPLGVGGSWDNTLDVLFGGNSGGKKK